MRKTIKAAAKSLPPKPAEPVPRFEGGVDLRDGQGMGRILFSDFEVNGIALKPEHEETLQLIRGILNCSTNARAFFEGRASQTGGESNNQWLSEMRATAIRNRLRALGVPESRLLPVIAHGSRSPLIDRPNVAKSYLGFAMLFIKNEHGKDQGIEIGGWQAGSVGIGGSVVVGPCIVMGPAN